MRNILKTFFGIGISVSASAAPIKVETDSFLFQMPSTWKIESLSSQAQIVGPNGEFLALSSYEISGNGSKADLQKIRDEFSQNISNSMLSAANDPELKIVQPLKVEPFQSGLKIISLRAATKNGQEFFDQYGVVGPKTAVLVTIEGKSSSISSSAVVKEAVRNIVWR